MQRSTIFLLGGGICAALGGLLLVVLLGGAAGGASLNVALAVGFAWVLGAFFVHVAREERMFRRRYLADVEAGRPPPPGAPPI